MGFPAALDRGLRRRRRPSLLVAALTLGACTAIEPEWVPPDGPELYSHVVGPTASTGSESEAAPLFVPGGRWFDADLGTLSEEHTLVFYDLRGRGRSRPVPSGTKAAPFSMESEVADLERLRARLGFGRISILGWAYQGGIAVRYALAHPDRVASLVLVNPLPPREAEWREALQNFEARMDPREVARLESMRRGGGKLRDPEGYARAVLDASLDVFLPDTEVRARMRSDPVVLPNLDPDLAARRKRHVLRRLGEWDWRRELEDLNVPTLLLHGEAGFLPLTSARMYEASLPEVRLVTLPRSGHMPWLDHPERFFDEVDRFLLETP